MIREPGSGARADGELAKLDTDKVRLRYPAGATAATLVVTYVDGSSATLTPADGSVAVIARAGTRASSLRLTYRGVAADGSPTIAEGADAGLDLTGLLNDGVDETDLAGGGSPGVVSCAGFEGRPAGRSDGTGTATGHACATLDVRRRVTTSSGTRSVGQTRCRPDSPSRSACAWRTTADSRRDGHSAEHLRGRPGWRRRGRRVVLDG